MTSASKRLNTPVVSRSTLRRAEIASRLKELDAMAKPRQLRHWDEDTCPHGQCDDPLTCDCECDGVCGRTKREAARQAASLIRRLDVDGGHGKPSEAAEPGKSKSKNDELSMVTEIVK